MENTTARYRHYRARTFIIMWIVYAGYYFTRKTLAVATPGLMDQYGLNEVHIGWISGAYLGLYALGQFINGILGDKLGARVMLSIGMIGSAMMSIWFGFTTSVFLLVAVWGANGFFQSSGWSNSVKSMAQWFSVKERGTIMGFYCTCYQIGSALATMFAAYVLGHYGLKSTFVLPAVLLLVVAVIFILFQKETPEKAGLPPIDEYTGENTGSTSGDAVSESEDDDTSVLKQVLSHPIVWLMAASYFCLKFVRYSLLTWLPLYLTKKLGYTPELSGYMSALPELVGFLGTVFAGVVSDKLMGSRRAPICAMMFLGLAIACYLQSFFGVMGPVGMTIGLSLVYFMIFGPDSIMTGAAAMDFGTRKGAATAAGFINGVGSIGAFVQAPLLGYLAHKYGYDYFFLIFIPLSIIPFILMLTQWNVRAKKS